MEAVSPAWVTAAVEVMAVDVGISIDGIERARRTLGMVSLSGPVRKRAMAAMGEAVLEATRDHLDTMARHRHACADRLGAKHTRHLEYASGRVGAGTGQATSLEGVTEGAFTVSIRGTPGLLRAFGPVTVKPRRGKWLTIPIHRDAYGKRVKDLRAEGRILFRPGKARILAEAEKGAKGRLRPLYALCREATSRRDRGLLPTKEALARVAAEAAEDFLSVAADMRG